MLPALKRIIMFPMNGKTKSFLSRYGVILFFVLYAGIGLIVYDDYGCGPDEGMERQTSLVNYKYLIEKLDLPVSQAVETWLGYLEPLHEYRDRYYGTAVQTPMVLIESAVAFTMEPAEFYGMRHLYTFINFFAAMICFYLLLKKRFGNRGFALTGTAMLITTPRFFAESFYNNKDVLFLSWYIIAIYFSLRWIENKSSKNALISGILMAFTVNTRLNGIALIPILLLFILLEIFQTRENKKKIIISTLVFLFTSLVTYFLITPVYWENPLQTFQEMLSFNLSHPNHGSDGNLFFGQLIDTTQVWYYIPVWIALTVPTIYILFSIGGFFTAVTRIIRSKLNIFNDRTLLMDAYLLAAGFIPLTVIIVFRVIIYNSWRHCYFFYATLIYLACVGIQSVWRWQWKHPFTKQVKQGFVGLAASFPLLANVFWIVQNHPYQFVYFAPAVREYAGYFSGDYWGVAGRDLLTFIIESDDRPQIMIDHEYTNAGSINRGLLAQSDRDRLDLVESSENADYILYSRDDKMPEQANFAGFEKVYSIQVDEDEIGIVFKRKGEGK